MLARPLMATVTARPRQRFLLHGVDWPTYGRLLRALAGRPAVRLTYDRGMLELMTPSHAHEDLSYLIGRLVDTLTEEFGLPVKGGRSTTFRRRSRRGGLEPDGSWWIANERAVRGKTVIDLRRDPPPDLALEIDVTHSSLDRLAIYAVLGVPEVWRFAAGRLTCHVLDADGRYTEGRTSKAFPRLSPGDLTGFIALRERMDENAVVARFRAWARKLSGRASSR